MAITARIPRANIWQKRPRYDELTSGLRAGLLVLLVVALLNWRLTADANYAGLWWTLGESEAVAEVVQVEDDCDCDNFLHHHLKSHQPLLSFRDKREAVDLVRNRLHILEQLDNQLKKFASIAQPPPADIAESPAGQLSLATPSIVSENGQQICLLPLDFGRSKSQSAALGCLAEPELERQVPPYMLNLRRQLLDDAQSLAQAVHLMPYNSLVMRSFTQPQPAAENPRDPGKQFEEGDGLTKLQPGLVVELSALGQEPGHETTDRKLELEMQELRASVDEQNLEQSDRGKGSQLNNPKAPGLSGAFGVGTKRVQMNNGACRLSWADNVALGREGGESCYWFEISEQLQMKINGSLVKSRESSSWKREKLVEAELHLFKLLPELAITQQVSSAKLMIQPLDQPQIGRRSAVSGQSQGQQEEQYRDARVTTSYHLKTNLLEVSLYQILPRKQEEEQPALRLLDIRRMDLHSSGWETFYVKRALEDWISDSSSNLGLVIKAKSMLDEPIRVGLVRFAGRGLSEPKSRETTQMQMLERSGRNHKENKETVSSGRQRQRRRSQWIPGRERATADRESTNQQERDRKQGQESSQSQRQRQRPRAMGFNLSHQPILVIYTTSATD